MVGDCIQSVGVILAALVVWVRSRLGFPACRIPTFLLRDAVPELRHEQIGNEVTTGSPKASRTWFNLADPIASIVFGFITLVTTIKCVPVALHVTPSGR